MADLNVFRMPDGLRLYRGRDLLARGDSDVLVLLLAGDLPGAEAALPLALSLVPA